MYAYMIYRNAVEWAFEAANLPIIKRSPLRYPHDAAFIVRHDLENSPSRIAFVEASAAAEAALGVKGDYFLCTGTLRAGSEDTQLGDTTSEATGEHRRRGGLRAHAEEQLVVFTAVERQLLGFESAPPAERAHSAR